MQQGKIASGSQSDKIQTIFNYQCGLIQNFTPEVAYQGFSPDLGWASQQHGTKFDHEMSPKYWSNSCPRGKHLRQPSSMSQCSLKKLRKETNTCHLAAIRLQPLPMMSPEETQDMTYMPPRYEVHIKEIISVIPDFCIFPYIKKAINSLTWRVAYQAWSPQNSHLIKQLLTYSL